MVEIKNPATEIGSAAWSLGGNYDFVDATLYSSFDTNYNSGNNSKYTSADLTFTAVSSANNSTVPANNNSVPDTTSTLPMTSLYSPIAVSDDYRVVFHLPGDVTLGIADITDANIQNIDTAYITINGVAQ